MPHLRITGHTQRLNAQMEDMKSEFELMVQEIEQLQKKKDDYREMGMRPI